MEAPHVRVKICDDSAHGDLAGKTKVITPSPRFYEESSKSGTFYGKLYIKGDKFLYFIREVTPTKSGAAKLRRWIKEQENE